MEACYAIILWSPHRKKSATQQTYNPSKRDSNSVGRDNGDRPRRAGQSRGRAGWTLICWAARPILPAVCGYNDNVPITSQYIANCSAQNVTRKDDKCLAAMWPYFLYWNAAGPRWMMESCTNAVQVLVLPNYYNDHTTEHTAILYIVSIKFKHSRFLRSRQGTITQSKIATNYIAFCLINTKQRRKCLLLIDTNNIINITWRAAAAREIKEQNAHTTTSS